MMPFVEFKATHLLISLDSEMEIYELVMPLFAAYYKRSNLVKIIEIGQAVIAHKLFISVSNKQLNRL